MTDPIPAVPETPWQPTPGACPRCRKPLQARCAVDYSRITQLQCVCCSWSMQIEPLLSSLKAIHGDAEPLDAQ